jgi:hypothetical protein
LVNAVHEGYLTLPEFSKPVLQYRLGYSKVCEGCVQKCTRFCKVTLRRNSMMIMTIRMRLKKSLMKLEAQNKNTINNNMKGS